jgi:methyl-accepting chemotaxis protein
MPDGPIIIPGGTTEHTGVMRGRDVREQLANTLPIKAVNVIAQIAEINHTNVKAIAELATMQEQIVSLVQQFADVAQNMKDRSEQMMRATEQLKQSGEGNEDA